MRVSYPLIGTFAKYWNMTDKGRRVDRSGDPKFTLEVR